MSAPSCLVSGLAKSGTTGLYHALKAATASLGDYAYMYEPKDPIGLLSLTRYAPERPVLTKILLHRLEDCAVRYADFDHRFMTVRDPRDIAVSMLLFRPVLAGTAHQLPVASLETFVEALRDKERDPRSASLVKLHRLADDLGMRGGNWTRLQRRLAGVTALIEAHDFTPVKYEDLVSDRLEIVSQRVGVPVRNPDEVGGEGWLSHIRRSASYGDWRAWFTEEDVAFFRPLFEPFLEVFDFDTSWGLAESPSIDSESSSQYVERKLRAHVEEVQARKPGWTPDVEVDEGELQRWREMALDGRVTWSYRLALFHSEGRPEWRDSVAARRWAREGAVRGHAPSMRLLASLLDEADSSAREARYWRCEHDRATGTQLEVPVKERKPKVDPRIPVLEADVRRLRRDLQAIRASSRYRVGSLLAAAASDPLRRGIPSLVAILRLALRRLRQRR